MCMCEDRQDNNTAEAHCTMQELFIYFNVNLEYMLSVLGVLRNVSLTIAE